MKLSYRPCVLLAFWAYGALSWRDELKEPQAHESSESTRSRMLPGRSEDIEATAPARSAASTHQLLTVTDSWKGGETEAGTRSDDAPKVALTAGGKRVNTGSWIHVEEGDLPEMDPLLVLPDQGIVYCPIPKVSSSEWKRALRWIAGMKDWLGRTAIILDAVRNGLERLVDWGVNGTEWALNSDRFFRFVIIRDPAERLLSGFLNKCVVDGYMRDHVARHGTKTCEYLTWMPELFPNDTRGSLDTNRRFKEMVEEDLENILYHFVKGVQNEAKMHGDECQVGNRHFRPQSCFCQLRKFLPHYYVMPFSDLSAEAATFADRLPAERIFTPQEEIEMDDRTLDLIVSSERMRMRAAEAAGVGRRANNSDTAFLPGSSEFGNGVDEERREEIRVFLTERFAQPKDTKEKMPAMPTQPQTSVYIDTIPRYVTWLFEQVTHAADKKSKFLSPRIMDVVHELYAGDYELFGDILT